MVKTSAQRQADHRARQAQGENVRLAVMVNVHTMCCLERLAACYGITRRAVLERLLVEAEHAALARLPTGIDCAEYYEKRLKLNPNTVTQ